MHSQFRYLQELLQLPALPLVFFKPDAERIFSALLHHSSLMKAELCLSRAGRVSSHRDPWAGAFREQERLEQDGEMLKAAGGHFWVVLQ